MNCFMKVVGFMTVLFGLGIAGSELTTVTWEAPPGVAAAALADVLANPFVPVPLAALNGNRNEGERLDALAVSFDLSCELCEETEKTCDDLVSSYGGSEPPTWSEYCEGESGSHMVPAHRFHFTPNACGDGGDPDFAAFAFSAGGECEECECAACGGDSTCHDYWDAGPCHADCEGGGAEFAAALEAAVNAGDITQGIELVAARRPSVRVVQTTDLLRIESACSDSRILTQFAIDSPFASALRESGSIALDE
jgi:hypothetical protein